ncbi:MAG: hypothetical protein DRP11_02465 [Candidatus Aenigmatarchaeota archaeon]|nr:MAG: hypothetical protein DRP11_02465 [Candidatus Aenigmarchaeota archaeon]
MNLSELYVKKSYQIFAPILEPYLQYFESLRPDLRKAGIPYNLREYLSMAVMTVLVVFIIEFPLLSFITTFMFGNPPVAILFSLTISIGFSAMFFLFFYIYPSLQIGNRRKKIDYALPFATIYLATTSGSRMPPQNMFKVLLEFEGDSEMGKEARKIVRDTELLGISVIDSIKRVATESPSDSFSELLWGMSTTISTGGNLSMYLHEKAKSLMKEYKLRLEKYSSTLGTIVEMYLTLVVVGSIFFIIMSSIMSSFGMGGSMEELLIIAQFFVIFLGLPAINAGFIMLIKSLSPRAL